MPIKDNIHTFSHNDSIFFNLKNIENNIYQFNDDKINADFKSQPIFPSSNNAIATTTCAEPTYMAHRHRNMSAFDGNASGLISIILIAILIIGILRIRFSAAISSMLATAFSEHQLRAMLNTFSTQNAWPIKFIHIVYFFTTTAFLYEISIAFNFRLHIEISETLHYAFIFGCVLAYHCIKYIINKLIGFAFDISDTITFIIQCKIIACDIVCVMLIPLITIFPFISNSAYNVLLIIAIVIIGYIYLWRIAKALKIILANYVSAFYSILYLCIVEIIPIVCLYKIATYWI